MRPLTVQERDRLHRQIPVERFADMQVIYKNGAQNPLNHRLQRAVDDLFTYLAVLQAQREDVLALADELAGNEQIRQWDGRVVANGIRSCYDPESGVLTCGAAVYHPGTDDMAGQCRKVVDQDGEHDGECEL